MAETGGRQQHDGGEQRPHAGFGDGLRDREDRPSWKPTGNEVAANVTTIVVKSGVSMHSANTDRPHRLRRERLRHRARFGSLAVLREQVDRLTDAAARVLADEKDLN